MARDKERSINPALAAHKASKNASIKKNKSQQATQRNEKLARRNPERLQRQIEELKATQEAQGGQLRPRDRETLDRLEKDVRAINKAREQLGDKAPQFRPSRRDGEGDGEGAGNSLGKRRRGNDDGDSDSEKTDEEARKIPMPKDTPPPIPRSRRKEREDEERRKKLKEERLKQPHQTSYSSAPQLRDLRGEAVRAFMPTAVASRAKTGGGAVQSVRADLEGVKRETSHEQAYTEVLAQQQDGDIDLDEEERKFEEDMRGRALASVGTAAEHVADEAVKEAEYSMMAEGVQASQADAERRLRQVEIEEVEDDGS